MILREMVGSFAGAARSFRRRPAFFAIATITLGLALGFATTVLGVVDGVRHPVSPFVDPDRTFAIQWWGANDKTHPGATSRELEAAIARLPAFDDVATGDSRRAMITVGERGDRGRLSTVPPNFFRVVGVRPRLGRLFSDEDVRVGNSVVVSDDLWRRYFGNRGTLENAVLSVDDRTYTIIGVMPHGMRHDPPNDGVDVWRPRSAVDSAPHGWPTGHLRSGASQAAAEAQLVTLATQLTNTFHVEARPYGFTLHRLRSPPGRLEPWQKALLVAALCVLCVACGNIATLMLARGVTRRRELALRLSLGARGRTLALDQLAEAALVAAVGGALGLVVAFWGVAGATRAVPQDIRWLTMLEPQWGWRIFMIALGTTATSVLLTGLLPAWQVARIEPSDPLKESSGGTTGRTARHMQLLVVAELAMSLVVLVAAALFIRTTVQMAAYDFGFDAQSVISASGRFVYRNDIERFGSTDPARALLPRVEAVPGVESASIFAFASPDRMQVFSDELAGVRPLLVRTYLIGSAGLMHTMGLHLIEGRDFVAGDEQQGAVILDELAKRALFPSGGGAVGHRVKLGGERGPEPWLTVVGVTTAADLYFARDFYGRLWPPIYASIAKHDERGWQIIARTTRSPAVIAVRINRELNTLLPASAAARVQPFTADREQAVRVGWFNAKLFGTLSAASLALAAAGLFAVLSLMVNQRQREFGVRVALGAQRSHLVRLVMRGAAEVVLGGTALGGLVGLLASTLVLSAQLSYGEVTDALSLVSAESVLIVVTLVACAVPALRASRADPLEILRAT